MNNKYSNKQKQTVIKDYYNGTPVTSISSALGIPRSTIYSWISQISSSADTDSTLPCKLGLSVLRQHTVKLNSIIEVLKNIDCLVSSPLREKLNAMEKLYGQYSVHVLCDAMDVPRGTFYNHMLRNKKNNTSYARKREEMRLVIREVFDEYDHIYGSKKITHVLQDRGYHISDKLVCELMQEMGLRSLRTTAKKDNARMWEKEKNRNVLQRQFHVDAPNVAWVSDVTCYRFSNAFFYICVVIDLFSRCILEMKISKKNSTQLVSAAFKGAHHLRQPPRGLIFHSDRGTQYTSHSFENLLDEHGVVQSLSASGQPHDNAVAESFFSSLKQEWLYRKDFNSADAFKAGVVAYIQFYNNERPHAALGYKSPAQFEAAKATTIRASKLDIQGS